MTTRRKFIQTATAGLVTGAAAFSQFEALKAQDTQSNPALSSGSPPEILTPLYTSGSSPLEAPTGWFNNNTGATNTVTSYADQLCQYIANNFSNYDTTTVRGFAIVLNDLAQYLSPLGYDTAHGPGSGWVGQNIDNQGWCSLYEPTSQAIQNVVNAANKAGAGVTYSQIQNGIYSSNPIVPIPYSQLPVGSGPLNMNSGYLSVAACSDIKFVLEAAFPLGTGPLALTPAQCGTLNKAAAVVGLLGAVAGAVAGSVGGPVGALAGELALGWAVEAAGALLIHAFACSA